MCVRTSHDDFGLLEQPLIVDTDLPVRRREMGAVSKAISIQPPFLASKALRRCGLLRKSKEGAGLRHGPCRHLPLFAFRQEELPYVVARGDQSPLERHLLKAP